MKGIAIHGHEFVGFRDGWRGVVEGDIIEIPRTMVRGIAKQGGTILGTSRTNPFENGGGPEVITDHMESPHSERGLDTFGRPRLGGIADQLTPEIEARTGIETRATRLGMAAIGPGTRHRWPWYPHPCLPRLPLQRRRPRPSGSRTG
ncbi:hypothetical protein GCM10023063_40250 [Arthrobacter methylotrophus]